MKHTQKIFAHVCLVTVIAVSFYKAQVSHHFCETLYFSNLENTFKYNFYIYDQDKICTEVSKIKNGPWIKEAKRSGIKFTEYAYAGMRKITNEQAISLLVGADIYGKLLTGKMKSLNSSLTAMQIKLGWTWMDKTNEEDTNDSAKFVISLHAIEAKLAFMEIRHFGNS